MTRSEPQRRSAGSSSSSTDETGTGTSPLHGAAFDKDLHQTPAVLWLAVTLICLGVALIGGAVIAWSMSEVVAVWLLVAGAILSTAGAAVGLRNKIMSNVA